MKHAAITAVTILVCALTAQASNYAESIHEFVPGLGVWPESPSDPLGAPDLDVTTDAYGIGRGGTLTLEMSFPFYDIPGADLTVYEYGTVAGGTNDSFDVYVSSDASLFHFVGSRPGDHTMFDLSGIGASGPFLYVKIVDTDTTGMYDGADIDAVEAMVPEPATLGLLGLGGLTLLKRRK